MTQHPNKREFYTKMQPTAAMGRNANDEHTITGLALNDAAWIVLN